MYDSKERSTQKDTAYKKTTFTTIVLLSLGGSRKTSISVLPKAIRYILTLFFQCSLKNTRVTYWFKKMKYSPSNPTLNKNYPCSVSPFL